MQQGGKGGLLGGWVQGALKSTVLQVVRDSRNFRVELPCIDPFLPHDHYQH